MKDKIKFLKVNEKNSINELTCNFKDKRTPKLDFHYFGNTITCSFKKVRDDKITLQEAKKIKISTYQIQMKQKEESLKIDQLNKNFTIQY